MTYEEYIEAEEIPELEQCSARIIDLEAEFRRLQFEIREHEVFADSIPPAPLSGGGAGRSLVNRVGTESTEDTLSRRSFHYTMSWVVRNENTFESYRIRGTYDDAIDTLDRVAVEGNLFSIYNALGVRVASFLRSAENWERLYF